VGGDHDADAPEEGAPGGGHPAVDDPGRQESEAERDDRNMAELLQELRVAGLGVQVLFGFLLALPFSARFDQLNQAQRDLYLVTLLLAALATALLSAPVAYHRLVFRRHLKGQLLRAANVMALLGLGAVGLAISAAVLLVVGFVEHGPVVPAVAVVTVAVFIGLWFVFPMSRRHRPGE
jgi:O-antigen/teichoic acid export membrane protein